MENNNTLKNPEEVGTYIFVPVYNVIVDPNILGKEFHGFDIISTSYFFNEYSPNFQKYGLMYQSLQLEWNLQYHFGIQEKHPVPKFLIRTGAKLPHIVDGISNKWADEIIKSGLNVIINYLMALRLYNSGNIQIERYFVISPQGTATGFLPESTVKEYIFLEDNYSNECWKEYHIAQQDVPNIVKLCKKMNSIIDIINIPLTYFQEYYSAKNTFDKLLKLVTVWECTLLNDCKSELTYKLQVRGSKVLCENLSKFFKLAYALRSDIVHTGKPSDTTEKQLRKFLGASNDKKMVELILIFIRDYMEDITRKILLYFVDQAAETHKSLEEIAQSIDSDVFEDLSSK